MGAEFDSGMVVTAGKTFKHTFTAEEKYPYCSISTDMLRQINVAKLRI
jgi:hypothetical protein